jgi:hypothetical protein
MSRELFRLSQLERELLLKHYDFYSSLASGSRRPTTDAQRHFLSVCRGQAEVITDHERAYMNFRKLVLLSKLSEKQVVDYRFSLEVPVEENTHEAKSQESAPSVQPSNNYDWKEIDEYGEGVPRPGWFSDEGWRRMRSGYRFDSKD